MIFASMDSLIVSCRAAATPGENVTPRSRPYWQLAQNKRKDARTAWEALLAERPNDTQICHELALAYYWEANDLEQRGENAVPAWSKAVQYFAAVLASDQWWRNWATRRAVPCGVLAKDRHAVQIKFHSNVDPNPAPSEKERVDSFCETILATRDAVQEQIEAHFLKRSGNTGSGTYRELLIDLRHEITVAKWIDQLKMAARLASLYQTRSIDNALDQYLLDQQGRTGIDVPKLLNTAFVCSDLHLYEPHDIPSCGPRMITFLGLTDRIKDLMDRIERLSGISPGVDGLLSLVSRQIPRIRIWLDGEYGHFMAMVDLAMFHDCRNAVLSTIEKRSDDKLLQTLCWSCHEEAKSALIYDQVAEAVEAFEIANAYGFSVLGQSSPFGYDMPALSKNICSRIKTLWGQGALKDEEARGFLLRLVGSPVASPLCKNFLESLPRFDE